IEHVDRREGLAGEGVVRGRAEIPPQDLYVDFGLLRSGRCDSRRPFTDWRGPGGRWASRRRTAAPRAPGPDGPGGSGSRGGGPAPAVLTARAVRMIAAAAVACARGIDHPPGRYRGFAVAP